MATFTEPVRYRDGVTVRVVGVKRGTVTDVGPGSVTGAEYTQFTIEVGNGSSRPLDLSQVVVSAYLPKDQQAQPVYLPGLDDFSETLASGQSASSKYAFGIPTRERRAVTLTVDLDGKHAVAVFTGPIPK